MTNSGDCPEKPNNQLASTAEVEEALADLPRLTVDEAEIAARFALDLTPPDHHELRQFDRSPVVKAVEAELDRRQNVRAAESAKLERERYALVKIAEGKGLPRAYQWHEHEPRQQHETDESASLRKKRDRQRTYRGTTNEDVEARKDALRAMTPDEKRAAKAARERARRAAMSPEDRKAEAERKARAREATTKIF